jgi:hypothetical protein
VVHRPVLRGAVPVGRPVAEVEGNGQGEHRRGATVVPGKEPWVGAHRGGGMTVGWQRDLGASVVGDGGSPDGGRRCPKVRLWLCEGEVRAEPN